MRCVIQKVLQAQVEAENEDVFIEVGAISRGVLILIGVEKGDTAEDASWIARKIIDMRIFQNVETNDSVTLSDLKLSALIISNFTLLADVRKGRRPDYASSEHGALAEPLFNLVVQQVREQSIHVETGSFGCMMHIKQVSEGPFTLLLDSRKKF